MAFLNFIINEVMRQPSIFLGIVVLLGGLFRKQKGRDIMVSVLKTVVGVRILQNGATILQNASKPLMNAVVARFAIQGVVADNWVTAGEVGERLKDAATGSPYLLGNIGLIMIGAWLLHLLLSRVTPLKVVYLTGHVAYTDTMAITFAVFSVTGWADYRALLFAIVLLALYWWLGPALIAPWLKRIVGEDPITLGHNMVFGGIFTMIIAKLVGNPKESAQDWKLPGWLSMLSDSVVAYSVLMCVMYTAIGIAVGPTALMASAAKSTFAGSYNQYILFAFMMGIEVAAGVTILLLGVRMFLAELIPAFHGFAAVVVPGATAAVDNPVFWPYATQAALLGLIVTPIGMAVGIGLQVLLGFPYLTVPSVIGVFFGGCTLGVFANAYGGWKGTIIATFIMGIVLMFGSAWFSWAAGLKNSGGWHVDYATVWPALFTILRFVFGRA